MDQLHSNRLRGRRWIQLEKVTDVNFENSPDLRPQDILEKDLMRFSDDVTDIVDGANNEVRMEKQLLDLKNTWAMMEFPYKPMENFPDLLVLSVPEELAQRLEENQVAVQNYLSSKTSRSSRLR
jgi:dynein heavy chain